MFLNYLKLSLRNLSRNKLFSLINIGGLASGIAMALLLFLYLDYEQGFDSFQSNKDRICRVISRSTLDEVPEKWGCAPNIAGLTFKEKIAGVKEQVRLIRHNFGDPANVKSGNNVFIENDLFWTDPSVTTVFDFTFVKGNQLTALDKPNRIVMSRWLDNFAFHISIGWSAGLLTLLIALLTAALTISFQAIKAAGANPVKSLRTE